MPQLTYYSVAETNQISPIKERGTPLNQGMAPSYQYGTQ
jgi:hypothetical protein